MTSEEDGRVIFSLPSPLQLTHEIVGALNEEHIHKRFSHRCDIVRRQTMHISLFQVWKRAEWIVWNNEAAVGGGGILPLPEIHLNPTRASPLRYCGRLRMMRLTLGNEAGTLQTH